MQVLIVRSCTTSRGEIVCEVPGGTEDQGPFEFGDLEAENLIASGNARRLPPAPAVEPLPASRDPAPAPAGAAESTTQEI